MKNKMIYTMLLLLAVGALTSCNKGYLPKDAAMQVEITENIAKKSDAKGNKHTEILSKDGIQFKVDFGYDNFVKRGRYARLYMEGISKDKDFNGTIYIDVELGSESTVYKKKVALLKGESQSIEVALPIGVQNNKIEFSLKGEEGNLILKKEVSAAVSNNEQVAYLAVLTKNKAAFSKYTKDNMKLFFLSEEDFSEDIWCLNMFDAILVYDFDTNRLNEKQKQAMEEFSRIAVVENMEMLPDNTEYLNELLEQRLSKNQKAQLEREKTGNFSQYAAYASASVNDTKKVPKTQNYLIVILIYILIIGPPIYFVLKKLDKPGAVWIAVPILSVIFTLIIYGLGNTTRQTEPHVGYFAITDISKDFTVENVYMSIVSPFNESYNVPIPKEYKLSPADMNYTGGGNALTAEYSGTEVNLTQEGTNIEVKDNAAFTEEQYKGERIRKEGNVLESSLRMTFDYKVEGTVTNTLGYDLHNACLCVGDVYVVLGELKAGETRSLKGAKHIYVSGASSSSLNEGNILEDLAGGNPNVRKTEDVMSRIYNAYQYFMERRMSSFEKEEVVLVGFKGTNIAPEIFDKMTIPKDGVQMVTVNGTADFTSEGRELIPNIDLYMRTMETYYFDAYRYMGGEVMKFEVTFPAEDKIVGLLYSQKMNAEFYKDSWNGFYGKVKAYNYYTEAYDVIFEGGKEKMIGNVDLYLNAENKMRLVLESDMEQANKKNVTIPVISAIKEVQ